VRALANLFGTDGVRGLANRELTPELAFELGRAGAAHLRSQSLEAHPMILVGKDTRRSGDMLEAALCAGICSVGVNVVRLGVVPTPVVAYLTANGAAVAGVMISASHNPAPDNGIKFFGRTGFKLPDADEDSISELMRNQDGLPRPTGEAIGRIRDDQSLVSLYVKHVQALIPEGLRNLKVVVDCAHGAAYQLAPTILGALGAELIPLHTAPDGDNINRQCGSTHLQWLSEAVVAAKADLGLAFDGDADRLLAVDETGQMVDGDRIMLICLKHLQAIGKLPDASVVATVMSNMGFEEAVLTLGGHFVRAKVGDRHVLEAMLHHGIRLGGEQSGHVIFLDDNTTGDGLITAVRLLQAIGAFNQPLSALAAMMSSYPQLLKNLRVARLDGWGDNATIQGAIAQAQTALGAEGRLLVRASGTEALLRVMVEGRDRDAIEAIANQLCQIIIQELGPATN
jgi:phosphoglucosamine mutase